MKALLWALAPGGGHFCLGETEEGLAYAGTTAVLLGAGQVLEHRNDELGRGDEVNTPNLLALKTWELSFFTTFRSALETEGIEPREAGVDDTPLPRLALAPFQSAQLSDPYVWGAALAGALTAAYEARRASRHLGEVERFELLGGTFNRDDGAGLYGAEALGLSLAAAVGEEALWRGLLQTQMEAIFGAKYGLRTTAVLFGAVHTVKLDGRFSWENGVAGGLAGYYLGWLFQQSDHRLARPIAAHFWFNAAAFLTALALDPADTPLQIGARFEF
ncbi:MAG: CPBP family intramembrane metalloprotease [Gammaproteobacteria bacterium]|nr:CPBP family intramembrane metalloprotease [Gammaproteobacteria bacterium]